MNEKYNNKSRKTDRRTLYTRNVIKDALLDAMADKNFEQITVTDVCRRAEITRATFYLHYQTLTEVLNELWSDALLLAEDECMTPMPDLLESAEELAAKSPKELRKENDLLPLCHRISQHPKYRVIFQDESISGYLQNKIFQCQRQRLIPSIMKSLNLTEKEATLLALFILSGTYNVNKSLNWKKNDTWYEIQSMLMKFVAGGYTRIQEDCGEDAE